MAEIIDLGSVRDRNSIALETSKKSRIPNARRAERAPASLAAAYAMVSSDHPSARLRSLSGTYNCFGMAFASRRTCIEPTHIPMILADDGYLPIEAKEVQPGDLVLYRDTYDEISHVAVVISHKPDVKNGRWITIVLSQWGADGEYIHEIADVNDFLGRPDKFYSEKRSVR
jgi:hypothetical protein